MILNEFCECFYPEEIDNRKPVWVSKDGKEFYSYKEMETNHLKNIVKLLRRIILKLEQDASSLYKLPFSSELFLDDLDRMEGEVNETIETLEVKIKEIEEELNRRLSNE